MAVENAVSALNGHAMFGNLSFGNRERVGDLREKSTELPTNPKKVTKEAIKHLLPLTDGSEVGVSVSKDNAHESHAEAANAYKIIARNVPNYELAEKSSVSSKEKNGVLPGFALGAGQKLNENENSVARDIREEAEKRLELAKEERAEKESRAISILNERVRRN